MKQGETAAFVFVHNGERRTGYTTGVSQTGSESTGEGGFTHAEAALISNDSAGFQSGGKPGSNRFGLDFVMREIFHAATTFLPCSKIVANSITYF